ncbi:hypothetical protein [Pseudoduganella chitinolytica]|uniref:Uncharacterized protein n=1 Tax=Pseudoduganella chitinolytica TaxID=34070 RepID=A0ABY8BCY4_9BURK|nr:hypothetical protein [Pseudoduganella chitinolytica]WEF32224.1 hypothetical protein PX653_22830 [Pseudoduganella chitinolytica]
MNGPGQPDDPTRTYRLDGARQQAYARLAALVDDACALLARRLGPAGQAAATQGPIDVVALRALSRQRQTAAARRREVVEAFVMGALVNHDNPAWNPLDPATSRHVQDSPLATLLTGQDDGQ